VKYLSHDQNLLFGANRNPVKILSLNFTFKFIVLLASRSVRLIYIYIYIYIANGFGGLGVACWPLVPIFVGSNRSRQILGQKNPQHAFLRRGSKAVGLMS